jgi:hypothetical protein
MVRTRQPHDPRLAQLERRLQREVAANANAKATNHEPTTPFETPYEDVKPPADSVSRPGAQSSESNTTKSWPPAAQPVVRAIHNAAQGGKKGSPENESPAAVDRFVRSLPTEAVEQFTTTLQPLIVNGCAAAACHAPTSENRFTLLRLSPGKLAPRRLTQRNLYNTVQLVDFSNPAESPLLKVASRPHGPLKAGVFGDQRSPKYRDLETWIANLTRTSLDDPQAEQGAIARTADTRSQSAGDRGRGKVRNHPNRFPGSVQQATFESPEWNQLSNDPRGLRKADKSHSASSSGKAGDGSADRTQKSGPLPANPANNRWPPKRDVLGR